MLFEGQRGWQYLEVIKSAPYWSGRHYGLLGGFWFVLPGTAQQADTS